MSDSGIAYRYQKGGHQSLPPIVLLHGLSQQADFWSPVIESLGSEFSTLSIDLRGHGESRRMEPDYRISRVSEDCMEVMNELGVGKAILVGHSWGASVALHFAAVNPQLSAGCVLVDGGAFTPANILQSGSITREELRVALTPPPGPFSRAELMANYLPAGIAISTQQRESVMAAVGRTYVDAPGGGSVTTMGFDRHMAVLEAFFDYDPDPDLAALTVPTWILIACDKFAGSRAQTDDDWTQSKSHVDIKVRQKMNIALQHWYGAVHDVPLYWPNRVAQLISHAASAPVFDGVKARLT
jgi:pimeloyl-ACP methyl ester carboxylesterase